MYRLLVAMLALLAGFATTIPVLANDGHEALSGQLRIAQSLPEPAQREPQLMRILAALDAGNPGSAKLVDQLRLLGDYRSQIQVLANPEHRSDLRRDAYPIATRARYLLDAWRDVAAAQDLLAEWQASGVLDATAHKPSVLAELVARAPLPQLESLTRADRERLPENSMLVLSRRLNRSEIDRRWLRQANSPEALQATASIVDRYTAAQAFDLLADIAASNPVLGSAAVLQMGRSEDRRVTAWLLTALDHPQLGASSAQALAQRPPQRWLPQLQPSPANSGMKNRLLALRWNGSPQARDVMQQWQQHGHIPAALSAEVASWRD